MTALEDRAKQTVGQVLDAAATDHGHRPAMRAKHGGVWVTTSWTEYREQARLVAAGFIKLGLQAQQGVSILGFNCPQWFLADIGAILAGGFPAGIYTTSAPEQCQYIADHSDSAVIVVENAEHLTKIKQIRDQLPKLKGIVLMFGEDDDEGVLSWQQLLDLGKDLPEADLEARLAAQDPDDTCTMIYTSGTTADPKAVMISHDNFIWTSYTMTETLLDVYEHQNGNRDLSIEPISYLPMSHVAEQLTTLHVPMFNAGCTSFAEGLEELGENLKETRPTLFVGVPRVWEKIQGKIIASARQNTGLKKRIGAWARKKGLAGGYATQNRQPAPFLFGLAERLVFSKVREALGLDRCFYQVTAAAPASKETLEFFLSLGIPIFDIYGMSECSGPATISTPTRYRTGKSGVAVPGTEVKVAPDGEVCMRGRHVFKGYYKNEEATAEALDDDGWLHSGDLGEIDGEGLLQITGRKKDLLITSGGKNIAPQPIENELRAIPGISQAVVIGDQQKFLAALLTLDPEKVLGLTDDIGSPARDPESAAECDKVRGFVEKEIEEINRHLARAQGIKRFKLLPADFTVEGGELTPTMKIKRRIVSEKYADEIVALYA